jgi:hypothetical protein
MSITLQPQPINVTASLDSTMQTVESEMNKMGTLAGKKVFPSDNLTKAVQIFEHSWFETLEKEKECLKSTKEPVLRNALSLLRRIPRCFRIVEKNARVGIIGRLFWSVIGLFTRTKYIYIETKCHDVEKFLKELRAVPEDKFHFEKPARPIQDLCEDEESLSEDGSSEEKEPHVRIPFPTSHPASYYDGLKPL